eukprot:Transcript_13202.p3 GENE.Transcript_13202~~Transcript_13202.p3  ORF type:complete len:186 (+),score=83.77 Transcript_13202:979-1536(+)
MIQLQLYLSPRLELMLQPAQGGEPLPATAPIFPFSRRSDTVHARHGGYVDDLALSSRALALSTFDVVAPATPPPTRLRVRASKGGAPYGPAVIIRGVQPDSTVNDIKAALLMAPQLFPGLEAVGGDREQIRAYYSPVFFTPDVLLGRRGRSVLAGTAPLSSCKFVPDDIIYVEFESGSTYHKPLW